MNTFDLNTDNYKIHELIEIFKLPQNFDKNILEINESKLRESIINNKQINQATQVKTLNFLTKAKNIILSTAPPQNTKFQKTVEEFYNASYELKPTEIENPTEHMVQVRKDKPYLSSYPSEFFPGIINPLKKRTIKKILNIDTRFRDNYYTSPSTNFNCNLPINLNDIVQMQLSAIELPTSYFVVSKQYGNNYFTISVTDSLLGQKTTVIELPDGNYDATTIMNEINSQLTLAKTPFSYVSFLANLAGTTGSCQTMVGPNGTGGNITNIQMNFQANRLGFDDRNTPLPLKFGWLIGFRNGVYTGNINIVSEGIIDLSGPKYFYLVIDDYNNNVNNSFYSVFNSSLLNKNILARISPLKTQNFSIIDQNNLNLLTVPREYFGPVNIFTMNIQLLDEYGRVVDLNNMDYSFCLTLTMAYDL
jgi:hypothetical protein